jgi:hypothetical protein
MPDPVELKDIDLRPATGKTYADITRDWREEFIYFLMLDRFHDSSTRTPNTGSARTDGVAVVPSKFYGGTLVFGVHRAEEWNERGLDREAAHAFVACLGLFDATGVAVSGDRSGLIRNRSQRRTAASRSVSNAAAGSRS